MNVKYVKPVFFGVSLALAAGGAWAKNSNGSQGDNNGKPFQELNALIDANRALIEENSAAISILQTDLAGLVTALSDTNARIDQLSLNVAANTADIATALAAVESHDTQLAALYADLSALEAEHAADFEAVNSQLDAINAEITTLHALRAQLAASVSAQLAALSAQVNDNSLAIDSLVFDLTLVNAQLATVNSSIWQLTQQQNALSATVAAYGSQITQLQQTTASLQAQIDALGQGNLFTFSGIANDVPVADLTGWTQCYRTTFADYNAHPENMVAACTGANIMLACQQQGSTTLRVAAHATRAEVFRNTGDRNNVVHTANGVDWYFSYNYSMGFAPVGEGVSRNSADTRNFNNNNRMSWHTNDSYTPGYRCGNVYLNGNSGWDKVIYQAD